MKQLRKYIRKILLIEAAVSPTDLPPNIGVVVYERPLRGQIEISYCLLRADGEYKSMLQIADHAERHGVDVWGRIVINKNHKAMNNTYQVAAVWTKDGYGPLLYDIAMELATQKANGLVQIVTGKH